MSFNLTTSIALTSSIFPSKYNAFPSSTHPKVDTQGSTRVTFALFASSVIFSAAFSTVYTKSCNVEAIYKVGCRGCDTHDYAAQPCATWKEAAKEVDISPLSELIKKMEVSYFPDLTGKEDAGKTDFVIVENDVNMTKTGKRLLENKEEEDIDPKNARKDV